MPRLPFLAAALALTACGGDPRADYAGTYDLYGNLHLTLVAPDSPQGDFHTGLRVEFIADALDAERLFVAYDCGIDAHLEDDGTFSIPSKLCPEVTSGSCRYRTIYDHGAVKRDAPTGTLQFTLAGAYTKACTDGSSVRENFSLWLDGKKADLSKPPPDPDLTPVDTPQALPFRPRTAG
jgi:hypothetical protein